MNFCPHLNLWDLGVGIFVFGCGCLFLQFLEFLTCVLACVSAYEVAVPGFQIPEDVFSDFDLRN